MSDLLTLKKLLKPNALLPVDDRRRVLFEESSQPHQRYKIELKNLPQDTLIVKTDCFPPPDKIFDCKENKVCKRADYVIITEKLMVFIEMKSGKGDNNKIAHQLKGARRVMDYCLSISHRFFNHPKFFSEAFHNQRFVSIKHCKQVRLQNSRIRERQRTNGKSPEKPLMLDGGNAIHFNQLVA